MARVRFAPSPTGPLHLGGALTAVANRSFVDERGGTMTLRIDDTDIARSDPEAEAAILRDLDWLGIRWDEGPVRQSERRDLYQAAAQRLLDHGAAYEEDGAVRFREERRPTILRPDGRATYHLASVVDDIDLAITHVIRGKDHLPNTPLHAALTRALGAEPPEYIHHGLLVGPDGAKLSKRHGASSVADLREEGIPAEAVRAYLEELDLPRSNVKLDLARIGRLAIEAIGRLSDGALAERVGCPVALAPAVRGSRTLVEARETARRILETPEPPPLDETGRATLQRFRELRERANGDLDQAQAREIVRELKAVGGDLRALRLALTGAASGPELWAVVLALPRDEALRRVDAAL
jgi:glutamyl/glutaminyl-tRNA synthetase